MTVESLVPISRYQGDGAQTVFPVGFPVFGDGRHVRAVLAAGGALAERELAYGVDYAVTETPGGGECVTASPVPDGHTLTLCLDLPCRQPRDFDNLGRLDAEQIEKGLDYVTVLAAQNAAGLERAVTVPVSSGQTGGDLVKALYGARDEARAEAEKAAAFAHDSARDAALADEARDLARQCADRANAALDALDSLGGPATPAEGADPATGRPGLVYPDGETITQTAEGMLTAAVSGEDAAALRAAVAGKLDADGYAADAPARVRAWGFIGGNAEVLSAYGAASFTKLSTGSYLVTLLHPAPHNLYTIVAGGADATGMAFARSTLGKSRTTFRVDFLSPNGTYSDSGIYFAVLY